jgi:hypothetical protein
MTTERKSSFQGFGNFYMDVDEDDDYDFLDDPIKKWKPQTKVQVPQSIKRPWGLRHFRKPSNFIEQAVPESRDEVGSSYGGTRRRSGLKKKEKKTTRRRMTKKRLKAKNMNGGGGGHSHTRDLRRKVIVVASR